MESQEKDVERIDIDPDGDLLLVLKGPRTFDKSIMASAPMPFAGLISLNAKKKDYVVEIRVSSYPLVTASAVFRSLVHGPFKEGSNYATARSNGVACPLSLPADNVNAMLILCKVLHFKLQMPTPSLKLMEILAVLCDKYQCTPILRFCGSTWLHTHREAMSKTDINEDFSRLFLFAYLADLAQEFNELAWQILLYNKGPIVGDKTGTQLLINNPLLPAKIINELNKRRAAIVRNYHDVMLLPFDMEQWPHIGQDCPEGNKEILRYIRTLTKHKLLGISYDEFARKGLMDLWSVFADLNAAVENSVSSTNSSAATNGITSARGGGSYRASARGRGRGRGRGWGNAWNNALTPSVQEGTCTGSGCATAASSPPEKLLKNFIAESLASRNRWWYGCLDCLKGNTGGNACRVFHATRQ
ncbi:hypothetical protein PpBr36_02049 [Pyricularia pennisetigena]|uniref:hypothetical protein n=1 Tax=Pyricularia pennisetigena TaxID=1578925 RepID=UPI00114E5CA4|nr:hypothetical protein PpBr36_02049 [Pyricularia pennisetigena]TLS27827.1 hypothetical protein PpBr36_02049 [Pyricularia pennisetigena]